ncbi:hypothetical protein PCASD_23156 [Puccinia coronata f. sp. avenae]|uniref:Uncharacterized protein n=1 Tax=Puccinia coronata f. sp. avenae TaxID=200324 RepID=A0A2N5TIH3_9BASI|nr:hypothetical protein PCASD_23156 [Puccinia coronata f. sp. avenae]
MSTNQQQQAAARALPLRLWTRVGQPLDDHNNTSTIIKAATAVSLILLGLALLFTVLKVTNWVRKKSEYSRLKAVEARVSQLEYRDLSSHSQPTLRNSGQSHHHLANPLSDLLSIQAPRNQNGGRKKLRNLFDIQEYEGTPQHQRITYIHHHSEYVGLINPLNDKTVESGTASD